MTKQSFIALIEKDEDSVFIGTIPPPKGCYSYGKTLDELRANMKEAIEAHLEAFGAERRSCLLSDSGIQEMDVKV